MKSEMKMPRDQDREVKRDSRRLLHEAITSTYIFLATLVALHFTPVSESVSDSFGLA